MHGYAKEYDCCFYLPMERKAATGIRLIFAPCHTTRIHHFHENQTGLVRKFTQSQIEVRESTKQPCEQTLEQTSIKVLLVLSINELL